MPLSPALLLALSAPAGAASLDVYPGDDVVALTSSLSPGSEVIFHDGTYLLESGLYLTGLGTEQTPIVLRAADGAHPVLELANLDSSYIVRVEDAAYITLRGLVLQGGEGWEDSGLTGAQILGSDFVTLDGCELTRLPSTAVYIAYDTEGVAITNNHIHQITSATAIYMGHSDASYFSIDSVISGNWIHDVGDDYDWAIYAAAGSQGALIQDNVIYDTRAYGIHVNATALGDANTVEGNVIWGVGTEAGGVGIEVDGPAVVQNNLIFNTQGYGIWSRDNAMDQLDDVVISFNTVANTSDWGVVIKDWAGRPGMVLANNVVANPTGYGLYGADGHTDGENYISSNVVTGLVDGLVDMAGAYSPGGGLEDFSDAEGWDFYPVSGSLLIDAGDPSSAAWVPQQDFNGAPREGDAPDVGAYEYGGGDNPGWAIREGFKQLSLDGGGGEQVTGGCCAASEGSSQSGLLLLPGLLMGMGVRRRRRPR